MLGLTAISRLLLQTRADHDNRAAVRFEYGNRRIELIPNALGQQALLLRLRDTTTDDYVDAILQPATLEGDQAEATLRDTLDQLEAQLVT